MERYRFRAHRPWSLRLWHWLNASVIAALLVTVLLRETLFEAGGLKEVVLDRARQSGTPVSETLAGDIEWAQVSRLWNWHHWLGFTLIALLVVRLAVRLVVERDRTVSGFLKAWRILDAPPAVGPLKVLHFQMVKTSYLVFYLVVAYMGASGLAMYFQDTLGLSKPLLELIYEVHAFMRWFFAAFIVAHIAGVVAQELRGEKGLVSDMINGGDDRNPHV